METLKNLKRLLLCLLIVISAIATFGQYNIGHTTITFNDPARSRDIQTEIYYPGDVAGTDVAISSGTFPVLIFGHGFVMAWDVYQNFWDEYVPQGYIMLFPRTEGNMSPDHGEYGADLAYLVTAIGEENASAGSIFYGAVATETAILGHSMGGGSSFIAAEINSTITTLVNFAAAETTPSAIAAAANITVPALVFSGAEDCVASPAENQDPMYSALASECKTHIKINGGGHCYFGNYSFNCTFGESTCLPVVPLSREEQHAATFDFLTPWLDFMLKENSSALNTFNDSLAASARITYTQNCNITSISDVIESDIKIYPVPALDKINIQHPDLRGSELELIDLTGKTIRMVTCNSNSQIVDITKLNNGVYFLRLNLESKIISKRFVVCK